MEFKRWRVFVDTSALLAGVISSKGAARQLMNAAELKLIDLMVSTDVLIEADRNIEKKFPQLLSDYRNFLHDCAPTLVDDPSIEEVKAAIPLVGADDAPILAAAIKAKADYLITWNTNDFMTAKVPADLPVKIATPAQLLEIWTEFFRNFLA